MGRELISFLLRRGRCDTICENIILWKVEVFTYHCNLVFINPKHILNADLFRILENFNHVILLIIN